LGHRNRILQARKQTRMRRNSRQQRCTIATNRCATDDSYPAVRTTDSYVRGPIEWLMRSIADTLSLVVVGCGCCFPCFLVQHSHGDHVLLLQASHLPRQPVRFEPGPKRAGEASACGVGRGVRCRGGGRPFRMGAVLLMVAVGFVGCLFVCCCYLFFFRLFVYFYLFFPAPA